LSGEGEYTEGSSSKRTSPKGVRHRAGYQKGISALGENHIIGAPSQLQSGDYYANSDNFGYGATASGSEANTLARKASTAHGVGQHSDEGLKIFSGSSSRNRGKSNQGHTSAVDSTGASLIRFLSSTVGDIGTSAQEQINQRAKAVAGNAVQSEVDSVVSSKYTSDMAYGEHNIEIPLAADATMWRNILEENNKQAEARDVLFFKTVASFVNQVALEAIGLEERKGKGHRRDKEDIERLRQRVISNLLRGGATNLGMDALEGLEGVGLLEGLLGDEPDSSDEQAE